mgnify:CR=1 FL=1
MAQQQDDKELLQQFKNPVTKEKAFTAIVKKYQEKLYWHIRRMVVEHEDANDVLQNMFIKVWKGLENFREDSQLYTWLYRIATNESLTFLEQQKKRSSVSLGDVENGLSNKLKSDQHFDANKLEWKLQIAIQQLPEKQRVVFNLRYYDEMPYEKMSRVLETSEGALKASYHHAVKKIEELHYSRLPVYKNNLDEVVGMLHTKDLLPLLNESDNYDWHKLMRQPYFVHEQKLIEDLLQEFRNRRNHFAIVVDEFGGTSGIVTLEDIMEEIIGDIKDEFDDEESGNKKLDDFNYIFEGKTMINDVCKALNLPVDTFDTVRGDSDSLAGLVLEIAGEFPQVNEEVVSGDFIFIPLEINKNRIDKVKITIKEKE